MHGHRVDPLTSFVRAAAPFGRALTLVALGAFLLLSLVGPSVALCVESDGSFSFEPVDAACCGGAPGVRGGDPQAPAETGVSAHPAPPAGCDDCIDVSLRIDVRAQGGPRPAERLAILSAAYAAAAAFTLLSAQAVPVGPRARHGPTGREPARRALRSVVLRC